METLHKLFYKFRQLPKWLQIALVVIAVLLLIKPVTFIVKNIVVTIVVIALIVAAVLYIKKEFGSGGDSEES